MVLGHLKCMLKLFKWFQAVLSETLNSLEHNIFITRYSNIQTTVDEMSTLQLGLIWNFNSCLFIPLSCVFRSYPIMSLMYHGHF